MTNANKEFHLILAIALASKEEVECPLRGSIPRNAIAVGTLPTGLQNVFLLLEKVDADAKLKKQIAASAAQSAANAKMHHEALKTLLFGDLQDIFSDEIPSDVGGIGIAPNWVVYYQTMDNTRNLNNRVTDFEGFLAKLSTDNHLIDD